jgi:ATPase family AAA domain-containing protein 3A/B
VRWEEQRKAIQEQAAYNKQTADYQAELRRRQIEIEHEKERERNRELVLLQQQSSRQMEAEKRQVAEQIEAERRATERYKVGLSGNKGLSVSQPLSFLIPLRVCTCVWGGEGV